MEELVQGTEKWKAFRKTKIGSSDAPAVMGESEWMTARELWMEKCGYAEFDHSNFATQRGTDAEDNVRTLYEKVMGKTYEPVVIESEDYPFMAASLDGFNPEDGTILEIKCPGKEVYDECKAGRVHKKYVWQLEHQLLVTGAKRVHFVCAQVEKNDKHDWVVKEWERVVYVSDPEKRALLIDAEKKFWAHVVTKIPPPLTERDTLVRTEPEVRELFKQMKDVLVQKKQLKDKLKLFEDQESSLKERMISGMVHNKEEAHGVRIAKVVSRKFSEKLAQSAGVDTDKFKEESVSYRVSLTDKEE